MAVKNVKLPVEPIVENKPALNESVDGALSVIAPGLAEINLESAIADELLDSIDWQSVKTLMIRKAKNRFIAWLSNSSDRPINISPFPELAALPSADDERAA